MTADDEASVVAATRRWIERAVIGLNLCPFARSVFETDGIRYVVSDARVGSYRVASRISDRNTSCTMSSAVVVEPVISRAKR